MGDDYRIVIPKSLRESVLDIKEGDVLWVIIGTVYPKGRQTIMIP
ncbi:MAG: hypothetical protein NZ957_02440 [Thaumarchaeota archaeon]|nr:hypothetical protein [Candidatus Calditenuaceae archaeon]